MLSETQAKKLIAEYGVHTVPGNEVDSIDAVLVAAQKIGMPVVLKVSDPAVVHKSDAGGVLLDLGTEIKVRQGAEFLYQRRILEKEFRKEKYPGGENEHK